ncbi:MAG: class I SAM-dependent methyltransferase [Thermoproteaceae archaeon]|nr:class I SAM-dependent methyltransferase [Thermoproteaceae archaeon]
MGGPPSWPWDLPLVSLYGAGVTGLMYDVPFVATPEVVARRMLQLARVRPGEVVYDLGSGDGRIVIIAVREFGARAVGIEIRRDLYEHSVARVRDLGLADRAAIIHANFFNVDVSNADVVTMYLLTSVNEKLKPKLERELKPGVRVVSHDFEVPGWRPIVVEEVYEDWRSHKVYLYKMPGREVPVPGRAVLVDDDRLRKVASLIDGSTSLEEIAVKLGVTLRSVREAVERLRELGAVKEVRVIK